MEHAPSAIVSAGHYRHWRLTSPKTRCSTLVERVHWLGIDEDWNDVWNDVWGGCLRF